jgi:formylglycine-generating enzyme required for sulfatase activity
VPRELERERRHAHPAALFRLDIDHVFILFIRAHLAQELLEFAYRMDNFDRYVLTAERERALKPLEVFRECAEKCPEMVVIPAGRFMMGSPVAENGRAPNEGPQHEVTIARPFAVAKFDVTFADWNACAEVGARR